MAVHCGFPTHSVLPMCSAPSNSSHQPASPDPRAHCLPPTLRRRAPERSRHLSPASPPSLLLSAAVIHSTDGAETLSPADVLSHSAHPSPVVMPPESSRQILSSFPLPLTQLCLLVTGIAYFCSFHRAPALLRCSGARQSF